MAASQRIHLWEIRQIHGLVAQLIECGQAPGTWRPLALEGLKALVGGNMGISMDMRLSGGQMWMVDPIDTGWQTESARRRFNEYLVSGEMAEDPGTAAWLARRPKARHVTGTRREMVDDVAWYSSPAVSEARKLGDVNDFVMSSLWLGPEASQGFVIYRAWKDRPFEARHRRLMKLFHLELVRAHRAALALRSASAERLSPRLRQTMELLLTPLSLKEIAAQLGLSRHTVNDYQKALYVRFGVTTRVELMHRQRAAARQQPIRLPDGLLPEPPPRQIPEG